jgi:hypothetical protein
MSVLPIHVERQIERRWAATLARRAPKRPSKKSRVINLAASAGIRNQADQLTSEPRLLVASAVRSGEECAALCRAPILTPQLVSPAEP